MEDFISQEEFNNINDVSTISIESIIDSAKSVGLVTEVLVAAFNHKGQFPKASTLECLQVGAEDWDVFG
jgi:hypothetical protein